jgi:hypothetical protein
MFVRARSVNAKAGIRAAIEKRRHRCLIRLLLPHLNSVQLPKPTARPFPNFSGTVPTIRQADFRLSTAASGSVYRWSHLELGPGTRVLGLSSRIAHAGMNCTAIPKTAIADCAFTARPQCLHSNVCKFGNPAGREIDRANRMGLLQLIQHKLDCSNFMFTCPC